MGNGASVSGRGDCVGTRMKKCIIILIENLNDT